ncbi:MAG: dNTP triphosphohydrolase [Rhodanobacteraceae bacterium]|nr:dNTP triphosphohydrolase [Rhodanobacteraceae bacterium]
MRPVFYQAADYERPHVDDHSGRSGESNGYRDPFKKDVGRLVHSGCFRRLQGKIQLYPGLDSDFFRNRLTHSIEVAQIARCIVLRINAGLAKKQKDGEPGLISESLLEFAGLAPDLGHPPFGHTGEKALAECMAKLTGMKASFEGNAQTIRILTFLERKVSSQGRFSWGLNNTNRAIASVLKYDKEISSSVVGIRDEDIAAHREKDYVIKGFYSDDAAAIRNAKIAAAGSEDDWTKLGGKVVECAIMDIADDIAYSTYDLEDSFQSGLLNPNDILRDAFELAEVLCGDANKALRKDSEYLKKSFEPFTPEEVFEGLIDIYHMLNGDPAAMEQEVEQIVAARSWPQHSQNTHSDRKAAVRASLQALAGNALHEDSVYRTFVTSSFVGFFVNKVKFSLNRPNPAFSKVWLDRSSRLVLEILKNLTYRLVIGSHRLRIYERRGLDIVKHVFDVIAKQPALMPDYFFEWYKATTESHLPPTNLEGEARLRGARAISDFIASLTDGRMVELYARFTSEDHHTIFKPPVDSPF